MPVPCQHCTATNPPQSNFCHRCGATLSSADGAPGQSASGTLEPTFRDVAADFKILAVDVTRYSAPRIKTGAIFAARVTRRSAIYGASGIRTVGAAIAKRANRPKPSPDQSVPKQDPPLAAPSPPAATTLLRYSRTAQPLRAASRHASAPARILGNPVQPRPGTRASEFTAHRFDRFALRLRLARLKLVMALTIVECRLVCSYIGNTYGAIELDGASTVRAQRWVLIICFAQHHSVVRALRNGSARSCGCSRSLLELPRKLSALTIE